MSVYLAKNELKKILENSNLKYKLDIVDPKTVAENKKGSVMDFENYSEEKLMDLVKNRKNIIVNSDFWNYNYCNINSIDPSILQEISNNLDIIVRNLKDFSAGTLIIYVVLHELLLNTFKIKNSNVYLEYLEDIKISRKVIRNFMINMEYQFPLTENYLTLILEVFNQETIFDFLFKKCCQFNLEEFEKVMEYFEVNEIHEVSYYIFTKFNSKKTKLEYIKSCLVLFEDKIDITENVIYTKKNKNPHLGYYLLTMKLTPDLENLYYSVMKLYIDKYGTLNIIVSDEEKNKFVEMRKKEVIEYFEKY